MIRANGPNVLNLLKFKLLILQILADLSVEFFAGGVRREDHEMRKKSLREHQNHIVTADLVAYAAPAVFKFTFDLLRAKKLLCFEKF